MGTAKNTDENGLIGKRNDYVTCAHEYLRYANVGQSQANFTAQQQAKWRKTMKRFNWSMLRRRLHCPINLDSQYEARRTDKSQA